MTLVLHHCHQARSMRSLWLIHELGVPFELVVHPFDKSLRAPEYLALSPAGRVPALQDGDVTLFETGAIAQYLCETYAPETFGRPPGHAERAEWLMWLHFAETLSVHAAALTQQHLVLRDDSMRSPVIMNLEAKRAAKCYDAIEARLRASGSYLLASGLSAPDISVGQAVYLAQFFVKPDPWPRLFDWYSRLTARAAFQNALPPKGEELMQKDFYPPWDMPA